MHQSYSFHWLTYIMYTKVAYNSIYIYFDQKCNTKIIEAYMYISMQTAKDTFHANVNIVHYTTMLYLTHWQTNPVCMENNDSFWGGNLLLICYIIVHTEQITGNVARSINNLITGVYVDYTVDCASSRDVNWWCLRPRYVHISRLNWANQSSGHARWVMTGVPSRHERWVMTGVPDIVHGRCTVVQWHSQTTTTGVRRDGEGSINNRDEFLFHGSTVYWSTMPILQVANTLAYLSCWVI